MSSGSSGRRMYQGTERAAQFWMEGEWAGGCVPKVCICAVRCVVEETLRYPRFIRAKPDYSTLSFGPEIFVWRDVRFGRTRCPLCMPIAKYTPRSTVDVGISFERCPRLSKAPILSRSCSIMMVALGTAWQQDFSGFQLGGCQHGKHESARLKTLWW